MGIAYTALAPGAVIEIYPGPAYVALRMGHLRAADVDRLVLTSIIPERARQTATAGNERQAADSLIAGRPPFEGPVEIMIAQIMVATPRPPSAPPPARPPSSWR